MEKNRIVYAAVESDRTSAIMDGLDEFFNVRFAGELSSDLIDHLKHADAKFGFVTHFPLGTGAVDPTASCYVYTESAKRIRELRSFRLDLPILVYAKDTDPSGFMRGYILGAGANNVVFEKGPAQDIAEIREKMSGLFRG